MGSATSTPPVFYPESDGLPMADNTLQFAWIQLLSANLAALFRNRDDVFVGGNLFWYPVEGFPNIVQAPDVFVVFDQRPGYRGSYKQWEENDVPMTVVFEIRSPNDSDELMQQKLEFYSTYGVEEYLYYDPERNRLQPYLRRADDLGPARLRGKKYTSKRLGVHFDLTGADMVVTYPDGTPFRTVAELTDIQQEEQRLREAAEARASVAETRASVAEARANRLAELVRKIQGGNATADEQAELNRLLTGS